MTLRDLALIRTHRPLVVETPGKINWVTDTHRRPGHLIGPNLKIAQCGSAVDGRERSVHRVLPARDFDAADARYMEPGIGREPVSADVGFSIGMEIHVVIRIGKTNVG